MVFDSLSELVSHLNNVTFQDDPDILGFEVTGEITGYKTRPWNDIVFINFQLQEDIGKGKFLKLACNTREDRCRFTGFEGSPKDGDKVTVKASLQYNRNISILQADVFEMRNTGKGDLLLKFQEIKERLAKEGLFDEDWKKELPVLPRRIGLITGSDGTEGRTYIYPLCKTAHHGDAVSGKLCSKGFCSLCYSLLVFVICLNDLIRLSNVRNDRFSISSHSPYALISSASTSAKINKNSMSSKTSY